MKIKINQLTKIYDKEEALSQLTVNFDAGKIIGLFGENGAGKSTLLKSLTGRIIPTSGTIEFEKMKNPFRHFYVVEEDFKNLQIPTRTILSIIRRYYPNYDIEKEKRLLEQFKISTKKIFQKLSKGQRGLVCCIAGIASGADLVILDETFVSVDISSRRLLYQLILEDYAMHNRSYILTSHHANELSKLVEDVFILKNGKLVFCDKADEMACCALELIGDKACIQAFTKGKRVLEMNEIGASVKCYMLHVLTKDEQNILESKNVKILPMDLDTLIMHIKEESQWIRINA